MSNAARPTWNSAMGTGRAPSFQYSSKDLKSHTKLKLRRPEQINPPHAEQRRLESSPSGGLEASRNFSAFVEEEEDREENEGSALDATKDTNDDRDINEEEDTEDEDDTEALLRELEKIKKEREEDRLQKEAKERERALTANPLTRQSNSGFVVKRRWDDDVVFRNQAGSSASGKEGAKRFVNDTLRSDFHRKFMNRYIK